MDVFETVVDCNGTPETVVTIQMEGESTEDFIARHRQAVDAMIAKCDGMAPPPELIRSQWLAAEGGMDYQSLKSEGQASHDRKLAAMKSAFPPLT